MKRLFAILIMCSCLIIWSSGGCNKPESNMAVSGGSEAQTKIPPQIAGKWQERGDTATWVMVIEPNGVVSEAEIPLMMTIIRPHHNTKREMIDSSISDFNGGDMFADYNPATRGLTVFIELKSFLVRYYDIRTGGSRIDTFTGPVSKDGKVWKCDWISVFDYGPDLPQDVNEIEPTPCTFDKVENDKK